MDNIISVKGLTKIFRVHYRDREGILGAFQSLFKRKYRPVVAVDHIDFNVEKGEIHALLGPNGAGKSTVIKMLSGILYPTKGEILAMGFSPWKERAEYVRNIGVLFGQKSQLTWELPAIDSYLIIQAIYKIPQQKFKDNLNYLVDLFQLGDIIKKPVRTLSLGEKMKCEFVCTLLHGPQLVFLDEPTIGMDVIAKDIVRDHIKRLNRDLGVTFILTSHDLGEITDLCKKITIINFGKIVFDDTLENLRNYYSSKKMIDIKFYRELTQPDLNQFQLKMTSPLTGTMEIDNQKNTLHSEITRILNSLPVQDLNIYENSVESVIKSIYQEKEAK
ncbi:MAG TPA: ATP-binding cassette domain-containing protein [Bacillota bacterium]|nr:ATP-binding cassette domain-containing protein [Bacillota bacterium]